MQPLPYYALGENAYARRQYDEALEYFLLEIQADPQWIRPWMSVGMLLLAQGRFEECRLHMETAVGHIPRSPILHMLLGDSYLNLDEYQAAIEQYQLSLDLLREHGTAAEQVQVDHDRIRGQIFKAMGDCFMMLENDEQAMEHFRQAIAFGESSRELSHKMALICIESARFAEAEEITAQILETEPTDQTGHQLSGYLAGCQRGHEALQRAMEQIRSYEKRLNMAGKLFTQLGKRSEFFLERVQPGSEEMAGVARIVKKSQKEFQKALRRIALQPGENDDMGQLTEDLIGAIMPHFKTHSELLDDVQAQAHKAVGDPCWNLMGDDSKQLLIQALYLEQRYEQARFSSGLTGIQYCFVLERELKRHLFYPFKQQFLQESFEPKKETFKIMANYIGDKINLSLGQMANVLEALKDDNPHELSGSMEALRQFTSTRLKNGLQLINSSFPQQVNDLAINYRNCWAHGENLHPEASSECRSIVLGDENTTGLLATFLEELR